MIETSGPGGAENMLINNVLTLRQQGVEGDVLLIKDGWLRQKLQSLDIPTHLVPLERFFSPRWLFTVERIITNGRYDALHAHEFAMNCHAAALSLTCRKPVIATVHGKNYYSDRLYRRLLYRWTSRAGYMVAVSDDIKRFLTERVGARAKRISVIANGIDIQKHAANLNVRRAVRQELNVGEADILIGAVGNLYPVKGHIYLIQAAAKILADFPNAHFVIAGRGGEQLRLQDEIDRLGIAGRFRLLGFREDVDQLLQAMDIFVMPSLSEGMPLSILEAMAAKKVIVASTVGGIPELIESGRNGVLIPPQNPDELASALMILSKNAGVRESIAANAYEEVCRKFAQSNCSEAYLKLYNQML
jgi:glycosyltransferase involved in cell wall biosynthesis